MDFAKLKSMSRDELLNLARTQGLTVHHRSKEETIIKAIMDSLQPQQPQAETKVEPQISQRPVAPMVCNTQDDVERAIANVKARKPQFRSEYDGDVWTFSYIGSSGRVLHAESGNLNIPLRTIVAVANKIAQGPIALMALNQHFDSMVATGPNAYTNTVLSK